MGPATAPRRPSWSVATRTDRYIRRRGVERRRDDFDHESGGEFSVYYQIRRRLAHASPAAFLDIAAGGARGFWAFGERWVAHAGVLEDLVVGEGEGEDACDPERCDGAGRLRFRVIERQAGRAFSERRGAGPARVFGGFAFSGRHRAEGVWKAFAAARFHLPVVEMEFRAGSGNSWLAVRDPDPARAAAECDRWVTAVESAAKRRASTGQGPRRWTQGSGAVDGMTGQAVATGLPAIAVDGGMTRGAWDEMVAAALRRIEAGEAEKVVLARTVEACPDGEVGPPALVDALWRENRGCYVFLFEPVAGHALVGAAPETVATLAGGGLRATAVAGSAGVGADSVETARLGQQLFNSEKDRAEHDFVVKDVVARLEALGCRVRRDVEPHILALAHIQHLETKIAADAPPGLTLLEALASLHPTPAVCGIPREVALRILTDGEVFDRGWYAGPVGWLDSGGRGVFVPALRSAVLSGGRWRLFAGAGIVPGSDPALEWEETEIKLRPVLRAMARARRLEGVPAGAR